MRNSNFTSLPLPPRFTSLQYSRPLFPERVRALYEMEVRSRFELVRSFVFLDCRCDRYSPYRVREAMVAITALLYRWEIVLALAG